jgi:Na+/phosphate symporter
MCEVIEEIADIAKRNAESIKAVMNEKRKLDRKLLKQTYGECVDVYCRAMTVLYTKNIRSGVDLRESITALHKKCDKYLLISIIPRIWALFSDHCLERVLRQILVAA